MMHMIYENIKRIADEKNLTIRAIEREAGLGNKVIAGWKESSPSVNNLSKVANVLGVSIEELLK